MGYFFGSREKFKRALPWPWAAALVLGTALPLSAQQARPCPSGDESAECSATAKAKILDPMADPRSADAVFSVDPANRTATSKTEPGTRFANGSKRPGTAPAGNREPSDERTPEPLLEFEKYVERSLGHPLQLFGRSLFAHAPSTFAPVNDAPVPADYVIGPGDELVVRGWGQVEIEARVMVDRAGQVFLPKVGMISVAGVHYADLHDHTQRAIQRVFHNFELSVSLGQLRTIQIYAVGQARAPGSYTVSSLSTLVNALFACGGPSARGSLRAIEVRRGKETVAKFDLYEFLLNGDRSNDVGLLPGDVVYIPPVGGLAAVAGSVNAPAIYEMKRDATLADALAMAGGLAATADGQKVSIERIEQHCVRNVREVALDGAEKNFTLSDGDVVRVIAVSPAIEDAVTLRGNVAHPGRYRWREGMRVHDLIPDRGFLLTEEYWNNKNKLVNGGESEGVAGLDVKQPAPEINWDYAAVQRTNAADLTWEILPFNLAKAIEAGAENDLPLLAGDVVTIFSERDLALPNTEQTKLVRLEGEVRAPGVYRCRKGETLRELVTRVGLTEDSYLFGAEFTRESTRRQQQDAFERMIAEMEKNLARIQTQRVDTSANAASAQEGNEARRDVLEKLRSLQPSGRVVLSLAPDARETEQLPGIVLEDGDRFVVPHTPATVGVAGEVYNQGALLYRPRLRVRDYLRDAGGPTRGADSGRMFVLRADGRVVSRQMDSLWSSKFEDLRIYPGDTIVALARMERGAFFRGLKDWSQVISDFALGAAAVKVLQ